MFNFITLIAFVCAAGSIAAPAPAPATDALTISKRQTTRNEILARQARGHRKRDGPSATVYSACPWNTGPTTGGIQNAYFIDTDFVRDSSQMVSSQSGSNSNACTSYLDNASGDPVVALYYDTTCNVYSSFTQSNFVHAAGLNTILKNTDCATAVSTYGNPGSGSYCCHMYAYLT